MKIVLFFFHVTQEALSIIEPMLSDAVPFVQQVCVCDTVQVNYMYIEIKVNWGEPEQAPQ